MNINLLNIVKQITAQYGESILDNPNRLKSVFSDLAKDEPKPLRMAFGRCLENGAYGAMKTAPDAAERASRKGIIAQRLRDEHGLDPTLCHEAMDILETVMYGTAGAAPPAYQQPAQPPQYQQPAQPPAYQQPPPQYQQPAQPPAYQQPYPPAYQQPAPPPQYQQPVYQQPVQPGENGIYYFTNAFKKYAVFQGRERRAAYWWFYLFCLIINIVTFSIDALLIEFPIFSLLWALIILLPSWGLMVRRFHDVDRRAWWVLVPIYNLILLCTAGTVGPNRFGPDPKQGLNP